MSYADQHQRDMFAKHELQPVGADGTVWKFARPDSGHFSLIVADLPYGIVLMGDIRFGRATGGAANGAAWAPGYSIEWFAGLGTESGQESYLCEKFLDGGAPTSRSKVRMNVAGWLCAAQQKFAELWQAKEVTT